jgi:1,4-alpha-glucan branching enzyme
VPKCLFIDAECQILIYERNGLIFALNFSPTQSYNGYWLTLPDPGRYEVVLTTDEARFGGYERVDKKYVYEAKLDNDGRAKCRIYLPVRTGICLKKKDFSEMKGSQK